MNRIDKQNKKIKMQSRLGFMTHVVAGYPNLKETRKIILMMVEHGVDFIEIQIPFSDPLGDGPTIHRANVAAIKNGFRVEQVFELAKILREKDGVTIPLLFMTYFNIVYNYGVNKFCCDATKVGVDGLIIPDYNFKAEKHDNLRKFSQENSLYLINFLSIDSTMESVQLVAGQAEGFVYFFARRGITGVQSGVSEELKKILSYVKNDISIPLAVGFGISKPAHIRQLKGAADIVVAGSVFLDEYNSGGLSAIEKKLKQLMVSLK